MPLVWVLALAFPEILLPSYSILLLDPDFFPSDYILGVLRFTIIIITISGSLRQVWLSPAMEGAGRIPASINTNQSNDSKPLAWAQQKHLILNQQDFKEASLRADLYNQLFLNKSCPLASKQVLQFPPEKGTVTDWWLIPCKVGALTFYLQFCCSTFSLLAYGALVLALVVMWANLAGIRGRT